MLCISQPLYSKLKTCQDILFDLSNEKQLITKLDSDLTNYSKKKNWLGTGQVLVWYDLKTSVFLSTFRFTSSGQQNLFHLP